MTKATNTKRKKMQQNATPSNSEEGQTKQSKIIDLISRKQGATLGELMILTEWKPHSVRGHISNLRRKKKVDITVFIREDGLRSYRILREETVV